MTLQPWQKRVFAVAAIVVANSVSPAFAHAILVQSTPAANATMNGPAIALSLRFNSRIDKARSKLTLTLPDKTEKTLPIAAEGSDDVLTAKAELQPGSYSLRWQVLAIDGHITRGDVPFKVKAP